MTLHMPANPFALSETGASALQYARWGWSVFPAPQGLKKSHKSAKHSKGRKWGATTDAEEIRDDFKRWPQANVGIVTGSKSGFFVVEADTLEGHGIDGIANLAGLIKLNGPLPDTIEALSPSGSRHIYFKWPNEVEIANSAGLVALGVDVRGEGGMIIGAPSVKAGAALPYRWNNPPGPFGLADCPKWLLRLCMKKRPPPMGANVTEDLMSGAFAETPWAEAALKDELMHVSSASHGNRNATLNQAAYSMGQIIAGGFLNEPRVVAGLTTAAQSIGLDAGEIASTIASGLAAGMAKPRKPKEEQGQRERTAGEAVASLGTVHPNAETDCDLSQDALASDMGAKGWDQDARYVALWNKWLFWTGTRWLRDDRLDHMTRARSYLRSRANSLLEWAEGKAAKIDAGEADGKGDKLRIWAKDQARGLRSKSTIAAIESLARSNAALVASVGDFDKNRLLLGTPGGTVDLRTGKLREAQRDDMLTMHTSITPATGTPSLWLAFLHEIFDGDVELIDFMQRTAGYALTGETREHKLLFLYGTGRNGKSVFLNTLFYIWGDYARRAHASTFLNSMGGDKHPTDLAGLQGARLVAGSELPKGKTWDESVIKDLTGGDVMTARYMRGDFFDFDPQLTLFIAGNNMPSFRGVDVAIRERVVLVPFTVTIPPERRDTHLVDKLKAEAGQILQWVIEGALQWQARGLEVPAKVAAASAEYFDDEDIVGQFLSDQTFSMPGAFLSAKVLHNRFTQWADTQGLTTWTQQTIVKEIRARGFEAAKSNGERGLRGLKLS